MEKVKASGKKMKMYRDLYEAEKRRYEEDQQRYEEDLMDEVEIISLKRWNKTGGKKDAKTGAKAATKTSTKSGAKAVAKTGVKAVAKLLGVDTTFLREQLDKMIGEVL